MIVIAVSSYYVGVQVAARSVLALARKCDDHYQGRLRTATRHFSIVASVDRRDSDQLLNTEYYWVESYVASAMSHSPTFDSVGVRRALTASYCIESNQLSMADHSPLYFD